MVFSCNFYQAKKYSWLFFKSNGTKPIKLIFNQNECCEFPPKKLVCLPKVDKNSIQILINGPTQIEKTHDYIHWLYVDIATVHRNYNCRSSHARRKIAQF